MIPESGRLPSSPRRYKHWIRSVNARLRVHFRFTIAREKPILAAVPFVETFFPYFFFFTLFPFDIAFVFLFLFSNYFFLLVTIHGSVTINRSLIFRSFSSLLSKEIQGEVSFSFFFLPRVYF